MDLQQWIKKDRSKFTQRKDTIRASLTGETGILDHIGEDTKEDIFYMLMFCLLVASQKQPLADQAAEALRKEKFYSKPMSETKLAAFLRPWIRFHNVKARRLIAARTVFLETNFWNDLKNKYQSYKKSEGKARNRVLLQTRTWLDSKIDGMALKLASHFMRNVGMSGLAILDTHVRNCMKERYGIGDDINTQLKKDEYYLIERKVKEYAKQVGISLDELDLLFCGLSK